MQGFAGIKAAGDPEGSGLGSTRTPEPSEGGHARFDAAVDVPDRGPDLAPGVVLVRRHPEGAQVGEDAVGHGALLAGRARQRGQLEEERQDVVGHGAIVWARLLPPHSERASTLSPMATTPGFVFDHVAEDYDRTVKSRDRFVTWTWVLGGAALVAAGTGGVLFFFDTPTPDSATVGISGQL